MLENISGKAGRRGGRNGSGEEEEVGRRGKWGRGGGRIMFHLILEEARSSVIAAKSRA